MAITTVEGTVERVFYEGKGAEIVERFTVKDREISKRWAAWFQEPHGLAVGSTVKVSGVHGDEISEWADKQTGEPRRSVKRSLNRARIEGATQPPAPAQDPWSAPAGGAGYGDDTPF